MSKAESGTGKSVKRLAADKVRPDECRDGVWTAIRAVGVGTPFTTREVTLETRMTKSSVHGYLTGLANAGYL